MLHVTLGLTLLLAIVISAVFMLGPHVEPCERTERLSKMVHLGAGVVPWIGENVLAADMTAGWAFAENASERTHAAVLDFYGLECAFDGMSSAYERRSGDQQGNAYLRERDPALYQMLYGQHINTEKEVRQYEVVDQ